MIRDLSLTLRALFARADVPDGLAGVDCSFDHPTESFTPSRTTLNLFLYDVREDLELRRSDLTIVRVPQGNPSRQADTALLRPPPLRVVCSYVLTVWPVGGEEPALQEHRLLGQALALLRRFPILPPDVLQGELMQQDLTLPVTVAQAPPGDDRGEFWTAVGNRLRPSITLRVTLAIPIAEPAPLAAPLVKVHELRVGERTAPPAKTLKAAPGTRAARRGGATGRRTGRTSPG